MKVNRNLCDVCGACVSVCPVDAIILDEFKVNIDNDKCIICKKCTIACPIKAISEDSDDKK